MQNSFAASAKSASADRRESPFDPVPPRTARPSSPMRKTSGSVSADLRLLFCGKKNLLTSSNFKNERSPGAASAAHTASQRKQQLRCKAGSRREGGSAEQSGAPLAPSSPPSNPLYFSLMPATDAEEFKIVQSNSNEPIPIPTPFINLLICILYVKVKLKVSAALSELGGVGDFTSEAERLQGCG